MTCSKKQQALVTVSRRFTNYYLHCVCPFCAHQREPRYVGLTSAGLNARLAGHLEEPSGACRRYRNYGVWCFKCNWIRKHGPENIRIELLEEYPDVESMKAGEVRWIAEYRARGYDLTNGTAGGDGGVGYRWIDEQRKSLSEVRLLTWSDSRYQEFMRRVNLAAWEGADERRAAAAELTRKRWEDPAYVEMQRKQAQLTNHARWHTARNVTNPACLHCDVSDKDRAQYLRKQKELQHARTMRKPGDSIKRGPHVRHHVNRRRFNGACTFCSTDTLEWT